MAKQKNSQTSRLARRHSESPGTGQGDPTDAQNLRMRLDKWLWCARFYKTRALATEEIERGRVLLNGLPVKPSREIRPGDLLAVGLAANRRIVTVLGLSNMRGPANVAQALYQETPQSIAERERMAEQRRLAPEPADMLRHGRPTKKDRREMQHLTDSWPEDRPAASLNARWSAGLNIPD